ncbi:MAG: hypothetical protein KGY66_04305 [Candidatus Thermoplasmatota archaeon]|nr:hypothetical protein [Candidatus Thermoplasmatota archaeon]MBS3790119.1 hypothetical protein [Candidatus Thermoplasmatota archaeon]
MKILRYMGVKKWVLLISAILSVSLASTALAHVPQTGEENESLEDAMMIEDPIKSWVVYSELHEGQVANYYEMEMEEGQRLYLGLLLPENGDFVPNLAVMGPGIERNESQSLPEFVETPDGVGIEVIEGELGEREYEPFTPGSYYHPASYDKEVNESGTYHVIVYNEKETGGKYGLAVGYEETWGPIEWIWLPIDVIEIHIWEGQPLAQIFAPMISVLAIGFAWTGWKSRKSEKKPDNPKEWGLLTSALLYIGSGAMLMMQMIIASSRSNPGLAVIVTIIFASLPLILGYKLWQNSLDFKEPEKRDRIKVIVYGFIGIFIWAGMIIGPLIAIISGLLPSRKS